MSEKISVIIHSCNSVAHIAECIESAKLLTSKVIVVDMSSTDKTVEIAEKAGARVVTVKEKYTYVEPVRELGIRSADTEWVFLLDTDERITPELSEEIRRKISDSTSEKIGFCKVPRKNIFAKKKWLQHGGWWPDYQTRLIHVRYFRSWPKQIHSTPVIEGDQALLKEPMLHYFHGDIASMVEKTLIFEDMESDLLFRAGREVGLATFFRKFFGELYRRLFRDRGFLDGAVGIIEAVYQAYSKTITYLYLYEKKKSGAL